MYCNFQMKQRKIIEGKPAPYPKNSTPEAKGMAIFLYRINKDRIKGMPRYMDKYPNSDGMLEITDHEQMFLGKVDSQFKTIPSKSYHRPTIQCSRSFLVYCQRSIIPVILFGINIKDELIYWRHIDIDTLNEVADNIKGNSIALTLPPDNCIDGKEIRYIEEWVNISNQVYNKISNYDALQENYEKIKIEAERTKQYFQNPIRLSTKALKEIHNYVDVVNYILDFEFKVVKEIVYPNVWKIGIGIIYYSGSLVRYVSYPVMFNSDQILVKETKLNKDTFFTDMTEGKILEVVNLDSRNKIAQIPKQYAYEQLEPTIMRVIGKTNFPINSVYIANEYITAFIDNYHAYLDFNISENEYSLKELKQKLFEILPVMVANSYSFSDHVTEHNHDIDSYDKFRNSDVHKKLLEGNKIQWEQGFVPKVKVKIVSYKYNIDLVIYYIKILEKHGKENTTRPYLKNQYLNPCGWQLWQGWNKPILKANTEKFFDNFIDSYQQFVDQNFQNLKHQLNFFEDADIVFAIFRFDDSFKERANLEFYPCKSAKKIEKKIIFLSQDDPQNPIDRLAFGLNGMTNTNYNGMNLEILRMWNCLLDFMFSYSPTYTFINNLIERKLEGFFRKKRTL